MTHCIDKTVVLILPHSLFFILSLSLCQLKISQTAVASSRADSLHMQMQFACVDGSVCASLLLCFFLLLLLLSLLNFILYCSYVLIYTHSNVQEFPFLPLRCHFYWLLLYCERDRENIYFILYYIVFVV